MPHHSSPYPCCCCCCSIGGGPILSWQYLCPTGLCGSEKSTYPQYVWSFVWGRHDSRAAQHQHSLYTVYCLYNCIHTVDSVYRGAVQSIRHPLYVWVRGRQVKWGGLIAPSLLGRVLKWWRPRRWGVKKMTMIKTRLLDGEKALKNRLVNHPYHNWCSYQKSQHQRENTSSGSNGSIWVVAAVAVYLWWGHYLSSYPLSRKRANSVGCFKRDSIIMITLLSSPSSSSSSLRYRTSWNNPGKDQLHQEI